VWLLPSAAAFDLTVGLARQQTTVRYFKAGKKEEK
jgi:hypothetical protein